MPLIRVEEEKKEEKQKSKEEKKQEKIIKSQNRKTSTKWYPVLYIICAIIMFCLGLLTIALINLAVGNGFKI